MPSPDPRPSPVGHFLAGIPGGKSVARLLRGGKRQLARFAFGPSQGEKYDRETFEVFDRVLRPDSSAIDIGANKGEILNAILRSAPRGRHWAFEPVPSLAADLKARFPTVSVLPYALAEASGRATFHLTKSDLAYSSLEDRKPALLQQIGLPEAPIEKIEVEVRRLDDVIPESASITLIKIDVEGAEVRTISGGLRTIGRCQPIVIFEAGFYSEDRARELFELFRGCGLQLSLMSRWLRKEPAPASFAEFLPLAQAHFYFIAHP
jgi:FkbM family methyltransferase